MVKAEQKRPSLIFTLVDLAILPAALLICAKAVGLAILNIDLGLNWDIQSVARAVFSVKIVYPDSADALLVSSYTNLFMFVCVLVGCMVVTSKSLLFNHKKASPYFVLKLARYDLLHLLKNSLHIFTEAFVWGVFLILTTIYISLSFISGQTYSWIAATSVMFCITFLWIMIQNIEEEILFHSYK